jgi:hypothetical protein
MTRSHKDEFPKSVKLQAWDRCKGKCECGCNVKIIAGDGPEYHHRLEVALSGDNTLENCQVLRKRCHDPITEERRPALDKVRRGFEKRIGARTKKPWPKRTFRREAD